MGTPSAEKRILAAYSVPPICLGPARDPRDHHRWVNYFVAAGLIRWISVGPVVRVHPDDEEALAFADEMDQRELRSGTEPNG